MLRYLGINNAKFRRCVFQDLHAAKLRVAKGENGSSIEMVDTYHGKIM